MRTRSRASRSRRVCLWTLASFFVSQLTLGLLLETCWPLARFAEARKILKRFGDMQAAGDSVDVVVLGSSRMMLGLREDALTGLIRQSTGEPRLRVLNAAVPGSRSETAAFVLDRLLERGARPRFVLIDISPESVGERDVWLEFRIKRLLGWRDVPSLASHYLQGRDLRTIRTVASVRLLPIVTYAPELRDIFFEAFETPPCDAGMERPEDIDWRSLATPPEAVPENVVAKFGAGNPFYKQNSKEKYDISPSAEAAFRQIAGACRNRRIPLLVIGPPLAESHRAGYTPAIRERYRQFAHGLNAAEDVRFFDCHAIAPEALFSDGHHLARHSGAIWFADYVAREILMPRWPRSSASPMQKGVLMSHSK